MEHMGDISVSCTLSVLKHGDYLSKSIFSYLFFTAGSLYREHFAIVAGVEWLRPYLNIGFGLQGSHSCFSYLHYNFAADVMADSPIAAFRLAEEGSA